MVGRVRLKEAPKRPHKIDPDVKDAYSKRFGNQKLSITQLTPGKYALFSPQNDLLGVGTWKEVETMYVKYTS